MIATCSRRNRWRRKSEIQRDENADLGRSGKLKMVAVSQLIAVVLMLLAAGTVEAQEATIGVTEAKSLVDIVLRHQGFPISSRHCKIASLDKEGQPFLADYYSFGASCDFPNTAATSSWGIYFVSPRTGDVEEMDQCNLFQYPELRQLQKQIMLRTHAIEAGEIKYRERIGCTKAK